jgi:hypothetical protein
MRRRRIRRRSSGDIVMQAKDNEMCLGSSHEEFIFETDKKKAK